MAASQVETFGDRFRLAFKGRKNSEIALELGVSKSAVTNYIQGRIPPPDTLESIARLTNCSLHWLILGEGPRGISTEQLTGEVLGKVSDDNGSSNPHLQTERPDGDVGTGSEEKVLVAHMELIIQQNNRIIRLLEQLVTQK